MNPQQTLLDIVNCTKCSVTLMRLDDILGIANNQGGPEVLEVSGHSLQPRPSKEPQLDRLAKHNIVYKGIDMLYLHCMAPLRIE